jgi:hypothetical protein
MPFFFWIFFNSDESRIRPRYFFWILFYSDVSSHELEDISHDVGAPNEECAFQELEFGEGRGRGLGMATGMCVYIYGYACVYIDIRIYMYGWRQVCV